MKLKIKNKILSSFSLALLFVFTALLNMSCDNHIPYDPEFHIGYILCDDHSCMDPESYFSQDSKKAVGVVFAEKTEDHPVLAVGLQEIKGIFCDSLSMVNGTSGDITTFAGFTNTISMYNSYVAETAHGCPIAQAMINFHAMGQSDYIPSVAEFRLLQRSAKLINPIIKKCKGDTISIDNDCWYWTSTEVQEHVKVQAWLCSAANGGIMPTPKTEAHKVRAINQISYPE